MPSLQTYMEDFFRLFVELQVAEACQLVTREVGFTVWTTSRKLHDSSATASSADCHFMVCGAAPTVGGGGGGGGGGDSTAALVGRLSPAVKTHVDSLPERDQVATVCERIAPMFGFGGANGVRRVLDDAGFILTPHMAAKLLQLHGR
jgi:hypothetical protein